MFGTSQDITESKLVEVELQSAMAGDRERLIAAGMSDYISKPLDRRQLIEMVDSWRPGDTTTRETREADMFDDGTPILDSHVMDDWQAFISEDEFIELINSQATDARSCMKSLKDAAADGDFKEVETFAHSLKSSCGSLGMRRVGSVATALERACRNDRFEEAVSLVPKLDEAVAAAMEVLEERYAEIFQAAPEDNQKLAG